jgi:hypothetical protein
MMKINVGSQESSAGREKAADEKKSHTGRKRAALLGRWPFC